MTSIASPVASPCTGVCAIDADTGWCQGCLRSLDEIAAWGALDVAGRGAVWAQLPRRRAAQERATREPAPARAPGRGG